MDKGKRQKVVVLTPPPSPPPIETDDDFVVCIGVSPPQGPNLSWLRLTIPARDVKLAKERILAPDRTGYIYHHHGFHDCPAEHLKHRTRLRSGSQYPSRSLEHDDGQHFFEYSAVPERNGPFPTDIPHTSMSAAVGSVVYCLGGDEKDFSEDSFREMAAALWGFIQLEEGTTTSVGTSSNHANDSEGFCHRPRFCDFGKPGLPTWSVGCPVNSPRYSPRMTAFDGKLYVFGGNDPSRDAPFAEVMDPLIGSWEPLPQPRFRMGSLDLFVTPIDDDSKMMLLYSQSCGIKNLYDTRNKNWSSVDFTFHGSMKTQAVSVPQLNSFYLLDRSGNIFAFNWSTKSWFVGSVDGLSYQLRDSIESSYVPLRHLHDDLFCLILSAQSCCGKYPIHLIVLQVVQQEKHPPTSTFHPTFHGDLIVSIVACFCYWFDSLFSMWAAHTLQMRSSTSMHQTVVAKWSDHDQKIAHQQHGATN